MSLYQSESFAGKTIVVTGAGRGQGLSHVYSIAELGATVIATDLNLPLEPSPPDSGEILWIPADVSLPGDWDRVAQLAMTRGGTVDGLVNNAGILDRSGLLETSLASWNRLLGVNLTGALIGIQTLAPLMPEGASIVNIVSQSALSGHFASAYSVSKWGLRGLSRAASLELGPRGIRSNAIFPGYISTEMTEAKGTLSRDLHVPHIPLGRAGLPDEVTGAVLFLLSDASRFISGAELTVDGGHSSHGGYKVIGDALREALVATTSEAELKP